ncbi:MAG: ester cyclase [Anaerolineales bacterium]|jgi:steroid delta-isomerase-like uncharacterized protein
MSTETNKATVRRMIERVWNEHRLDLVEEFYSEDVILHSAGNPAGSGLEALREATAIGLKAFPDQQLTIQGEIAEGDIVAARWTATGTHKGELMGIPPTGKQFTHAGMTFYRLANAKIVEAWFLADSLGQMQQLGVLPAVGAA